ncbi:MAG: ankyrin repeat domain-containing protein [Burkholderiaceae bacterium]|nr:ankyrin repeat domain-containing protein [Burkholderiaceae bacterium]
MTAAALLRPPPATAGSVAMAARQTPPVAWESAAATPPPPPTPARPSLAAWLAQQDFPGPHARGENGDTPLMRAARQGEHAVIEALLACGAAPEAINDDGNNALWFACMYAGPATILRLIQAGAPIDHANDDDITCLMQAAASGRLEIVHLLLAQGAAPGPIAPDGRNAFDMAESRGLALLRLARRCRQLAPS